MGLGLCGWGGGGVDSLWRHIQKKKDVSYIRASTIFCSIQMGGLYSFFFRDLRFVNVNLKNYHYCHFYFNICILLGSV